MDIISPEVQELLRNDKIRQAVDEVLENKGRSCITVDVPEHRKSADENTDRQVIVRRLVR